MASSKNIISMVAAGSAASVAATSSQADPADFAGAFLGIGVGTSAGQFQDLDYDYGIGGNPEVSIFSGYNWAMGDLVVGGEVSYSPGSTYNGYDNDSGYAYGLKNLMEVRARIGTTVGDSTLLYGAVGAWTAESIIEGDIDGRPVGISLGAGFETNLDGGIFLGADVTTRSVSAYNEDGGGDDDKVRDGLVSANVRVGYRF